MNPSEYDEGGEAMREEFRAFLILLLDMLERGETGRAAEARAYIRARRWRKYTLSSNAAGDCWTLYHRER